MRKLAVLSALSVFFLATALLLAEGVGDGSKARIGALLKEIQEKAKNAKPERYEVALPVSSAGARGAEMRQADRFAVIWPDSDIAPLTALAQNIEFGVKQGDERQALCTQVEEFRKTFAEFAGEPLLTDLAAALQPR